jgi:hypothetical protein
MNNKFFVHLFCAGLLASAFLAAVAGNAADVQNAPRLTLAPDSGTGNSAVTISLESFPSTHGIDQLKGFSPTSAPAIQFLRTYYKLGRKAQRDELIKLYAPDMQAATGRQFPDEKAVANTFADLGDVDVGAALAWGTYRVVLVTHHSRSHPQQAFPWVHTIDCRSRCVFVQDSELMQMASYLFYLNQFDKQTGAADGARGASLTLTLHPVFSDMAAVPGQMSDPVVLTLVEADPAVKGAGAALLAKLLKYPDAGAALADAEKNLFDGKTPAAYPRKAGDGKTVDLVAWKAYLDRVRSKTWPSVQTYRLSADTAMLIARSAQNDVLFLPFHRAGNGWRLFTQPSRAPFWPLFEGRPAGEAIGRLYKKP